MTDHYESLSNRRRLLLLLVASAFMIWQVPAMDMFDRITGGVSGVNSLVATVGFVLWALSLVALLAMGRRHGRSAVRDALEDELVRANRQKSFLVGYVGMLVATTVMFAVGISMPATALDAAQLVMVVGVVLPIYAFVILDARNG